MAEQITLQSPETILYLSNVLYIKNPETYTIAIAGYVWDLKTSISKEAEINLSSAYNYYIRDFFPVSGIGSRQIQTV